MKLSYCGGVNNSVWSGDQLLWDTSIYDIAPTVTVWDGRARVLRQLETDNSYEDSVGGSFWYQGRVYWLRSSRREIVSSDPKGGPVKRVRALPGGYTFRLTCEGGRAVWLEEDRGGLDDMKETQNFSLQSMMLPKGKVERLARLTNGWPDIVRSDRMIAWIGTEDGDGYSENVIHVLQTGPSGEVVGQPTEVPVSLSATGGYEERTLAVSGDRLVWTPFELDRPAGFYTWHLGDSLPTRVEALAPLKPMDGQMLKPAVAGDLVAWLNMGWDTPSGSIVARRVGDTTATILATRPATRISSPIVSDGRVIWAEGASMASGGGPPATIVMWHAATGAYERIAAPTLADVWDVEMQADGERITYTSGETLYLVEREGDPPSAAPTESVPATMTPSVPASATPGGREDAAPDSPVVAALLLLIALAVSAVVWFTGRGRRAK